MAMFQLYWANVTFIEENKTKRRPILQLTSDLSTNCCFAEVSSQLWHESEIDIVLDDWQLAGLLEPSLARLGERCGSPSNLEGYIGKLNRHDVKKIIEGLKHVATLNIHKVEEFDDEFTINSMLTEVLDD